jgi:hypothetical protein
VFKTVLDSYNFRYDEEKDIYINGKYDVKINDRKIEIRYLTKTIRNSKEEVMIRVKVFDGLLKNSSQLDIIIPIVCYEREY